MFQLVIELVLEISGRVKSLPALGQALKAVLAEARLERACLDCRLYAEIENPGSLRYVEQWPTEQELEVQLRSRRFGMLLAIMETAPAAPRLEVHTVSERRGLEYVSSIRLGTAARERTLSEERG